MPLMGSRSGGQNGTAADGRMVSTWAGRTVMDGQLYTGRILL